MAVRFKLNHQGVQRLLQSQAIQADLARRARRVATAAGTGHSVEVFVGHNRARATVRTITTDASIAAQAHQNLTRALQSGR